MKMRLAIAAFVGAALLTVCSIGQSSADFDRDRCYQKCRRTPGFMAQRGPDIHLQYSQASYDECLAECDRDYWKDFDSRTGDLDKKGDWPEKGSE
jgi:hypothetical protein